MMTIRKNFNGKKHSKYLFHAGADIELKLSNKKKKKDDFYNCTILLFIEVPFLLLTFSLLGS